MKAELLSLLTAKTSNFELSSKNHDAITSEDIAHYLGTKKLNSEEYDILMAKYCDNEYAREVYRDNIFIKAFDIFVKNKNIQKNVKKILIKNFTNLAIKEVIDTTCIFCNGKGKITDKNYIKMCVHCEGTGQFIYDDNNRPQISGIKSNVYNKYKKLYYELLNYVKEVEISALSKIGDES